MASKVLWGGFAEQAVVRSDMAIRIPRELELATAVTFPVVYTTALIALTESIRITPGETVLVLAAAGGLIGAIIAYVLFNNVSLSTLGANFTQVVFAFKVTPQLVLIGLIISVVIGFFGGLPPAARAARLPITTALRES